MTVTSTPIYPQTVQAWAAALVNGTGAFTFVASSNVTTNLISLVAGGTNGSKVEAINVSTTDTSPNTLLLILNNGTANFILSTFSIPANSGNATSTPSVSLFANTQFTGLSYDSSGNKYFYLPTGSTLFVGTTAIVTSSKQVSVVAVGASF